MRCKLAAVYRLVDINGWSETIFNHISVSGCFCFVGPTEVRRLVWLVPISGVLWVFIVHSVFMRNCRLVSAQSCVYNRLSALSKAQNFLQVS